MDTDLPSNSHKSRQGPSTPDKPKVDKVITGEVVIRKPPLGQRLLHTFFGGDAHSVVRYVIGEIVVPAVRDILVDSVSSGFERLVMGERRHSSPSRGYRPSGQSGYVSYNSFSRGTREGPYRREEPVERPTRRHRGDRNPRHILFQTRVEAQEVLNRMFDLINEYRQVTWEDLLEMLGISSDDYTDGNFGWTDIQGTTIIRVTGGYFLDLPVVEPLRSR